jgi:solute:Na+ symporter, SSS family
MDILLLNVVILVYLLITLYLGYRGWKGTKNAEDYMVAGRSIHPWIMALSYGATFISTSAIVGFGGVAGVYGMGLLWLPFLNIFVGIFIAFVYYGKRTRKMGHNLSAMTFPELIGKRFDSKFLQYFSGGIIFLGMPLYAGVVLIGMARFVETTLMIDFNVALLVLSFITVLYVLFGGLKGVIYTDALQAVIMIVGMAILLVMSYIALGGITESHQVLTDLASKVPKPLYDQGMRGWTEMPAFNTTWWWTLVTSIIMGVGIGVLAIPQLAVRFMTVKSNKELNRGVIIGGIFILLMTAVPYTVGALSNVYFMQHNGKLALDMTVSEKYPKGNADSIIPLFINSVMPEWFIYIFMLSLLSAAMSTLSSQIHTQGTALGRDIYETLTGKKGGKTTILVSRIGIMTAIILAVILGYLLPDNIIARGTAIFFGICAAAFLPVYTAGLFWKKATKAGAAAGIITGTFASVFMIIFMHAKESTPLGLAKILFGRDVLITEFPWPVVDPIVVALPLAIIATVGVSLLTKPPEKKHLDACFKGI